MSHKLSINEVTWNNGDFYITCNELEMDANVLTPAGRVLVDSDELAFIYILETPDKYVYLPLPVQIWGDLKRVLAERTQVYVTINEREIVLENLIEELEYVISNIEGNANYGDKMVEEVEAKFIK